MKMYHNFPNCLNRQQCWNYAVFNCKRRIIRDKATTIRFPCTNANLLTNSKNFMPPKLCYMILYTDNWFVVNKIARTFYTWKHDYNQYCEMPVSCCQQTTCIFLAVNMRRFTNTKTIYTQNKLQLNSIMNLVNQAIVQPETSVISRDCDHREV